MRTLGVLGLLVGSLSLGRVLADEAVLKIKIGGEKSSSQSELSQRVYMLERAVDQLQRRVFELEYREGGVGRGHLPPIDKSTYTTCYIKTPFDGTYSATEPTETAARAGAMEKCSNSKAAAMYCSESRVKCGK